jgi:hypothetical protein
VSQSEAQEVDSIGPRVGNLESRLHTVEHQMRVIEAERLPNRVGVLETTANQMAGDLHDMKDTVKRIGENQAAGFEEFRVSLARHESSTKTRSNIMVTLLAILSLIIGAIGLIPKFDAVVVEKTPTKATIKE